MKEFWLRSIFLPITASPPSVQTLVLVYQVWTRRIGSTLGTITRIWVVGKGKRERVCVCVCVFPGRGKGVGDDQSR
jgi:hypothetical protein